jgi:hypothetical protein
MKKDEIFLRFFPATGSGGQMARIDRQLRQTMRLAHRRWVWRQEGFPPSLERMTEVYIYAHEPHESPVVYCEAARSGVPDEIQIPQRLGRGHV